MEHRDDERLMIAERAAEWLARLRTGSANEKRAFMRWLRRSPEHVGETLLAQSTDVLLRQYFRTRRVDNTSQCGSNETKVIRLDSAAPEGDVRARTNLGSTTTPGNAPSGHDMRSRGALRAARKRATWVWLSGLGIGVAAAVSLVFIRPALMQQSIQPQLYHTEIGEQRAIELSDGSAVSINAQSSVQVKFSEHSRDVYLREGQAMFTVAKNAARPFRVHVDGTVVQAIGTKFDVRRAADRIQVAVVEGTVQVSTDRSIRNLWQLAEQTRVTAGQGISVADTGHITAPLAISVPDVSAWQQRRLVFSDTPLAEIADEFARFNRVPQLRVEGSALRARRISGVFDADSPEALLMYLKADTSIAFESEGDEIIIRQAPLVVQSPATADK